MKYLLYRAKRRTQAVSPEIVLTPLIDTALTLLVIFMITSPMLKRESGLKIELPKGNVKEFSDTELQEMVVGFDKKNVITVNGKVVAERDVVAVLEKMVSTRSSKAVFVKADSGAVYGRVYELVDRIKQIKGVSYVALSAEKA